MPDLRTSQWPPILQCGPGGGGGEAGRCPSNPGLASFCFSAKGSVVCGGAPNIRLCETSSDLCLFNRLSHDLHLNTAAFPYSFLFPLFESFLWELFPGLGWGGLRLRFLGAIDIRSPLMSFPIGARHVGQEPASLLNKRATTTGRVDGAIPLTLFPGRGGAPVKPCGRRASCLPFLSFSGRAIFLLSRVFSTT